MRYLALILCFLPNILFAAEMTGYVAVQSRQFFGEAQYEHQDSESQNAFIIEPEFYHSSKNNRHNFALRPFLHLDSQDDRRTHADMRDASYLYARRSWEVKAGMSQVFWGVVETNHLVDIINQTDQVASTDGEDKFGEAMLQFALIKNWGTLRAFYLPYFRERSFVGQDGRLRGATLVNPHRVQYEAAAKQFSPSAALRYEHALGDWDVGLAHFSGTSREPSLIADGGEFYPYYQQIEQTSADIQYTVAGWLFKFEGLTRAGHGNRFYAYSGGFEYSFTNLYSILAEYHQDNRSAIAPSSTLEHDLFLGNRFTLNNISDTQFLGGMMVDVNDGSKSLFVEASRRFGNHYKVEIDARFYADTNSSNALYGIREDDHIQINFARYF